MVEAGLNHHSTLGETTVARELVQIQEAGRRIFVHFLKSVSWFSSAECICMRYTIIIPNTALQDMFSMLTMGNVDGEEKGR